MQLWYPDTCKCVFIEDFEAGKVVTRKLCERHKSYEEAVKDSELKDRIVDILLEYKALPNSFVEEGRLKKDIQFKYYFDNGKIVFSLEGGDNLSPLQKANIEAVLNHVIPNQYEFKDVIIN